MILMTWLPVTLSWCDLVEGYSSEWGDNEGDPISYNLSFLYHSSSCILISHTLLPKTCNQCTLDHYTWHLTFTHLIKQNTIKTCKELWEELILVSWRCINVHIFYPLMSLITTPYWKCCSSSEKLNLCPFPSLLWWLTWHPMFLL